MKAFLKVQFKVQHGLHRVERAHSENGFFLRVKGVFTHGPGHLHHDLGDIAKGFYGMDTTTSLKIQFRPPE